jgi:copper chaperone NosL
MGGDESVPFREAARARQFARDSGGRVVTFAEMPRDYILQYGDESHAEGAGNDR